MRHGGLYACSLCKASEYLFYVNRFVCSLSAVFLASSRTDCTFHVGQAEHDNTYVFGCCRLAALSDGHISGQGDIVCPYHGWEFNGEGRCTHNPQVRVRRGACWLLPRDVKLSCFGGR